MNELIIEQTPKTPQIDLNQLTGDLIFSGKSIPENAAKVYEPVLNWVTEYILNASLTTNFRLNLEYYNTASSIWLTKILKVLIRINEPDYTLIVHLYLPIADYDEMDDFDDIKDAFIPISNIEYGAIPCIGIKLYGTDDNGEIIKETLVFIENE
ncbi:MAG TPA: SiaC family regulatory phosphoprotein [Bacteroidales bacterium]|nr:SiaC family regulatory phosphoprotein [Bacteroidales bacterium]